MNQLDQDKKMEHTGVQAETTKQHNNNNLHRNLKLTYLIQV